MLINHFELLAYVWQGKKDQSQTRTIRQRWNLTIPPSLCALFALYIYAKTFLRFYHIDTDEFNPSISTAFSHSKVKELYCILNRAKHNRVLLTFRFDCVAITLH